MMAGDGTLGLELVEDVPDLTDVFVSVGGGGFIGSVCRYAMSGMVYRLVPQAVLPLGTLEPVEIQGLYANLPAFASQSAIRTGRTWASISWRTDQPSATQVERFGSVQGLGTQGSSVQPPTPSGW